jgi:hypothetical protein
VKEKSTKTAKPAAPEDELRPEYDKSDLKNGVRGKYATRFRAGTNLVRLAPEVAAVFATEEAVNEALRLVIRMAHDANRLTTPVVKQRRTRSK